MRLFVPPMKNRCIQIGALYKKYIAITSDGTCRDLQQKIDLYTDGSSIKEGCSPGHTIWASISFGSFKPEGIVLPMNSSGIRALGVYDQDGVGIKCSYKKIKIKQNSENSENSERSSEYTIVDPQAVDSPGELAFVLLNMRKNGMVMKCYEKNEYDVQQVMDISTMEKNRSEGFIDVFNRWHRKECSGIIIVPVECVSLYTEPSPDKFELVSRCAHLIQEDTSLLCPASNVSSSSFSSSSLSNGSSSSSSSSSYSSSSSSSSSSSFSSSSVSNASILSSCSLNTSSTSGISLLRLLNLLSHHPFEK